MFADGLISRAGAFISQADKAGLGLVCAESCTGGLLAALLTSIAGSSAVFREGVVVYSNHSKMLRLGVSPLTLAESGAVSAPVVREMCEGALLFCGSAGLSVAISGVAGPGGGGDKPSGLVWIGWCRRGGAVELVRHDFPGTRNEVRMGAVAAALDGLFRFL